MLQYAGKGRHFLILYYKTLSGCSYSRNNLFFYLSLQTQVFLAVDEPSFWLNTQNYASLCILVNYYRQET